MPGAGVNVGRVASGDAEAVRQLLDAAGIEADLAPTGSLEVYLGPTPEFIVYVAPGDAERAREIVNDLNADVAGEAARAWDEEHRGDHGR